MRAGIGLGIAIATAVLAAAPATDAAAEAPARVWVIFTDKGPRAAEHPASVSLRSAARRAKVGATGAQVAAEDAPLWEPYVERVAERVTHVRHRSRWFNAISVDATPAQIRAVRALPEVRAVTAVGRARRAPGSDLVPSAAPPPAPERKSSDGATPPRGGLDYGASLWQVETVGIPTLHARGLTGAGVLIGHFDNGHRLMTHQAFQAIQVVAERDFVDGDGDTAPPPGAPDFFGAHGVSTLSVLGGFAPGQLVGPAYGAEFALARTEDDGSETPFEEDNWVAAVEWADSLGCDIISSSVGYLEYDLPHPSHTWQDMDGNTTVITRAADRAVARGIVVVTSAGNGGAATGGRGNTLVAPADADSALTIGGVWQPPKAPSPEWYFTSSVGPTAGDPPRTKPDLAAPGAAIYIASAGGTGFFGYSSGTSFACPLVAGVVALLLEAQPQATPLALRDALRATASRSLSPNNQIGWGIVDGPAALAALESTVVPATMTNVKRLYR